MWEEVYQEVQLNCPQRVSFRNKTTIPLQILHIHVRENRRFKETSQNKTWKTQNDR